MSSRLFLSLLLAFNYGVIYAMDEALITAASSGNLYQVKILLQNPNINVNVKDSSGSTALLLAIKNNKRTRPKTIRQSYKEIVHELLQDRRINLNAQEFPLLGAVLSRYVPVVHELLLYAPVNNNGQDDRGLNPLHVAARNGDLPVLHELLQDSRFDVNAVEQATGDCPLHAAVISGFEGIVRELLQHHQINAVIQNRRGFTPLQLAKALGRQKIVDLIQEYIKYPVLVLAMATHPRLGEQSGAKLLASDGQSLILRTIFEYLTK